MGPPFITPKVDTYEYRLINLDNGIQALLVHDQEADKAAAACDVRVGSLSDYEDLPGIAHFLEHMLFYSSEKYPEEDAYSKFITEHGGHTNAYTANESTAYHFSCNWDALPEALDRFAQFFVAPLISADGVQREVNAVDSEHAKNMNSDAWKKLQLWKATANPAHPFSHFSTGNLDTLMTQPTARGETVHERVRQFYLDHYSAGLMRVAVVGRHSLDEMEALVSAKFGPVVNNGLACAEFPTDAVAPGQLGQLIRMVPERDGHTIELQWPTLSEQHNYRAAPSRYVSHLLGHEGEGSAFALLKARGWATALMAGEAGTSYSSRSFFMCQVDLTEEGQAHVAEVVEVIFAYLALLRAPDGIQESIWSESEALARLAFNFRDTLNPYSYASSLAHAMQVYRPEDLLLGMYGVPQEFRPDLIALVVADLTPDNARVMWASKALAAECTAVDEWYGTPYHAGPIPEEWMAAWRAAVPPADASLHLPAPNDFIPSDFSLLPERRPQPEVATESPQARLWLRPDPSFNIPRAVLYLHIHLPEAYASPTSALMTRLYIKLVNDALSEVTYPADVAGLAYSLRADVPGAILVVSGYHHKLSKLAEVCIAALAACDVRNDRFKIAAEKLRKDFANMAYQQPYQLAMYDCDVALEAPRWHVDDYSVLLPDVTPDILRAFLPRLMSRCRIEAFATGNLPEAAATALVDGATATLRARCGSAAPFASELAPQRAVKLRPGHAALLRRPGPNPANDNSAVVVLYEVGQDCVRTNALADLLVHIGKRDAFYQLRTVEQLGYLTFFTLHWTLTVCNLAFIIQSSGHTAAHLESRVEAFLPKLRDRLAALPTDEFYSHVEELAKSKLEKPKRLREVAGRDWHEIDSGVLRFARREEEVAELRALQPADLLAFFEETVGTPATRRKLAAHIQAATSDTETDAAAVGGGGGAENGVGGGEAATKGAKVVGEERIEVVADVYAWKQRQELYPCFP